MYKQLRIVVPIIQVVLIASLFAWGKLCHDERTFVTYIFPSEKIVRGVNFPVVMVGLPILYSLDHFINLSLTGAQLEFATGLTSLVLVSTVGLFWYLVVAEIEMRRRGSSVVRFSNSFGEVLKICILFAVGVAAFAYAFKDTMPLLHIAGAEIEASVSALFPTIWGIIFIGMAIRDLKSLIANGDTLVSPTT